MQETKAIKGWGELSPSESQKLLKALKLKGSPSSTFGQLPKKTRIALTKYFNANL